MIKEITNRELLTKHANLAGEHINIKGWIRNNRAQKAFGFLIINDGTTLDTVQIVYDDKLSGFSAIQKFRVGSSVEIIGTVVLTENSSQKYEIKATRITLLGDSPEDFPIQPKRHTKEFLRTVPELRPRTNLFNAVFRVRSGLAFAVHQFFQEKGFVYVNTPIITTNDGEGAGEMFTVTTLPLDNVPLNNQKVDYKKDFFGTNTHLTVTGQLEGESFAMAFRNIYTFGPTFRSEKSNTPRHASEFWMIEPEMSFCDITGNMDIAEEFLKYLINYSLKNFQPEMSLFDNFVEKGLLERLNHALNSKFERIEHKDAIEILIKSGEKFINKPEQGKDLATEHEKYLTDEHFDVPVFITHWPKDIKAFYMKENPDKKTVAAMDLLVHGSGELIGGSERETEVDILLKRMKEMNIPIDGLDWYVNLRKYGSTVRSGFGLGFERLIMYITGLENIRDVVPFPRTSQIL